MRRPINCRVAGLGAWLRGMARLRSRARCLGLTGCGCGLKAALVVAAGLVGCGALVVSFRRLESKNPRLAKR